MLYLILFSVTLSQGIIGAQSIEELNRFKEKYSSQKNHLILCQDQLMSRKIPKNCYQVDQFKNNSKALSYIDEKCQEVQFVTLTYSEVKEGLKFPMISDKCKNMLYEKEKVLKHIIHDQNPKQVIKEFF